MACTMGSRGGEPARSQFGRCASIAQSAAYLCVPAAGGATFGGLGACATDRFETAISGLLMSVQGRQ